MQQKCFKIEGIPAILWGEPSDQIIIAVHGNLSNKADVPIEIMAQHAVAKGYQLLSFDLPEHGDRKEENVPCKVQNCVKNLKSIMAYVRQNWEHVSLFANSMGAYFSLVAYGDENIERAWFLSPVVDMRRIIKNMMTWFDVTEERLEKEQTIATPVGQNLYWDYYCYVNEHPIRKWQVPTTILYGKKDEMCEIDTIFNFTKEFACSLQVVEDAAHYFHTEDDLKVLNKWIERNM